VVADPSLVRDGTDAISGSATGASAFAPNPSGGPTGFTTLVNRILDYALGAQVQSGVAQPASATTGLGATGTLSAGYAAPTDLAGLSAAVVSAQAQTSGGATTSLATATGVQTALQSQATSESGVNIDQEMSSLVTLQNAYGANARIISAVQTLWSQLLAVVN
jgi:flagellar hook-associated protein 1 FlgK